MRTSFARSYSRLHPVRFSSDEGWFGNLGRWSVAREAFRCGIDEQITTFKIIREKAVLFDIGLCGEMEEASGVAFRSIQPERASRLRILLSARPTTFISLCEMRVRKKLQIGWDSMRMQVASSHGTFLRPCSYPGIQFCCSHCGIKPQRICIETDFQYKVQECAASASFGTTGCLTGKKHPNSILTQRDHLQSIHRLLRRTVQYRVPRMRPLTVDLLDKTIITH